MKSLRRSYDKKRSTVDETDAAAAEAQSGENESDPDLDCMCVRLLLQWGTHSGVSAESASRGIEDRTALLF